MSFDSGQLLILEDGVLTDRTSLIHDDSSFNFGNTRGRRGTASVPLMIDADDVYLPKIGWPVWIYEVYQGSPVTTQAVFVGVISEFQFTYFNDQGDRVITLTVVSLEKYFDTIQTPQQEFTAQDAGAIFTAIFNEVIALVPAAPVITLGTVDAGVSIAARSYTGQTNAAQDFQQLATDSAYIWYIDPRDLKVYFHAHDSRPVGFTITSGDIYVDAGKSSIQWSVTDVDFRNRQLIQQTLVSTTPPNSALFLGDGTTTSYTLPSLAAAVTSAFISTAAAGSSTATFTAQPSGGDTVTVTNPAGPSILYTFVTSLDNTVAFQILIGATLADTIANFANAINAIYGTTGFSTPTGRNPVIAAQVESSTTMLVSALAFGPSTVAVTTTSSAFSWSDSPLAGGAQSGVVQLSCGPVGSGQFQLTYTPGSAAITLLTPVPVGVHLNVTYEPQATGLLSTANDMASSFGVASQFRAQATSAANDQATAIQEAAAKLAAYSVLPKVFSFQSDTPGLFCGSFVTVALTDPPQSAAVLNGNWLIQDVKGDWIAGFELNAPPFACHFRYTYTLINTTEVSTYQDTLLALIDTGPFILPPTAQPTPNATTATTDHSGGTGSSGGDTMTAGQQWVQEQLGFSVLQAGNDLVMATSSTVSSASYSFTSGDVGRSITIVTATGWTPGSYGITSVTAGVATITGSPAISGTTGGLWGTTDPHIYQFTLAPAVSFWTSNAIAIVIKLTSNGDSPLTFKAQQLTPFAYAEVGYSITPISASGPDYTITGDQLTLRDPLADGAFLVTEYFPDKPVKLPHKQAGDAPAGAQFIAVSNQASSTEQIMTSPDAVTWTAVSSPFDGGGAACIATDGAGVIVALGFDSGGTWSAARSTDHGATWSSHAIPQPQNPGTSAYPELAFGAGTWVSVESDSNVDAHVISSTDGGVTWSIVATITQPNPNTAWNCITFAASKFVIGGVDFTLESTSHQLFAFASDPSAWTVVTSTAGGFDATGIATDGTHWVAADNDSGDVLYSTNPTSGWVFHTSGVPAMFGTSMAFGAGVFLGVGYGASAVMSSSDGGTTWNQQTVTSATQCNRVRFIHSLYVICCADIPIITSPDGAVFTSQDTSGAVPNNVVDVTFG